MRQVGPKLLRPPVFLGALASALALGALAATGRAQAAPAAVQPPAVAPAQPPSAEPAASLSGELGLGPDWAIHTQATVIEQSHPSFPAAYNGPNSLTSKSDTERTSSFSLFLDYQISEGTDIFYNPDILQGHGLSNTLGIAGFPNGEAEKAGFRNLHYNTSRLFIQRTFGLGGETESIDDYIDHFPGKRDIDRLTISVGKFSATDFFDDNAYSHDPRTQFMNEALMDSAAWDYPADDVGYTGGAVAEWNGKDWTWHYGVFMEPTVTNGARLDYHLNKANGQILQYDRRYQWGDRTGTIRAFIFWNQAHMGSYADAATQSYPEDVALTQAYRSKAGFGSSWDQQLTADLGAFARLSWNDGRTEDFAFTEIDRSAAVGLSLSGASWGRPSDILGLAGVVNGISPGHQHYLEEGGTGLILGDGGLSYSPEEIVEAYYGFQPRAWLQISPDFQYVRNPGYNNVRGPVPIYAVRAHIEF